MSGSTTGQAPSAWEDAVRWLRDNPETQRLVIDGYYDDPLIGAAERYRSSPEWAAIRALLDGRCGNALDVGAGRGITAYAFARDGHTVTALEPDSSELVGAGAIRQLFGQAGLPVQIVETFSERLPFESAAFDVVFARAVLHHTTDLEQACKEFYRVLKPGGLLLAIREHVISQDEDLPKFFDIHPLHHRYGGENAFLLSRYEEAIRRSGLDLVKTLAPFESAMNYAPYTLQELRKQMAARLFSSSAKLAGLFAKLLSVSLVWSVVVALLNRTDHRPGRLYSFVAVRRG